MRSAHIDRKFGYWPVLAGTTLVAARPCLPSALPAFRIARLVFKQFRPTESVDAKNLQITIKQIERYPHRCYRRLLRRCVRRSVSSRRRRVVPLFRRVASLANKKGGGAPSYRKKARGRSDCRRNKFWWSINALLAAGPLGSTTSTFHNYTILLVMNCAGRRRECPTVPRL